jgi:hypothetical protein
MARHLHIDAADAAFHQPEGETKWTLNELDRNHLQRDRQIGSLERFGLIRCSMRPHRLALPGPA